MEKESASFSIPWRACAAEFLASFLVCAPGFATNCTAVLLGKEVSAFEKCSIICCAITLALYATCGISGGHLNSAGTLLMVLYRGFPFGKGLCYMVAQTIGAYAAAALNYWFFHSLWLRVEEKNLAFDANSPNALKMVSILVPTPHKAVDSCTSLMAEIFCVSCVMFLIIAVVDEKRGVNTAPLNPLLIGLILGGWEVPFATISGGSINPARDLGSRIFVWGLGKYGSLPWTSGRAFPHVITGVCGPFLGSVIGGGVYYLVAGVYKDNDKKEEDEPLLTAAA